MTPLETILKAQITAQGPMRISDFMTSCLFHPKHGYYSMRDPFGTDGDFITSPDISQMFGELIGLTLAQVWIDQGKPAKIALVELGPGRGTLMADILRVAKSVPGFANACDVHLIEASHRLRDIQAKLIKSHQPTWHDDIGTLPSDLPLYGVANEFFDALPIRQMIRASDGWSERMVGLEGDALSFGLSAQIPFPALDHRLEDTTDGDLVEICPMASPILQSLSTRIETNGGCAVLFDYGDWRSLGDTLQAVKAHEQVPPLSTAGQCDLTAHVDFEALVSGLACTHSRLTPQGVFLERLGITERAQTLAKGLSGRALDQHITAHRRLTHTDEMGTLFKTIALFPSNAQPPAGYEV